VFFAVENVGLGHIVEPRTHELLLHQILNLFDVHLILSTVLVALDDIVELCGRPSWLHFLQPFQWR